MDLQYFPNFMRANYPEVSNESNENLIELGAEFQKYLNEKFKGKEEKLAEISDISPKTVIFNIGHPFKVNGYHPALVYHFTEFVKQEREKANENPSSN